nr:alpha carbonic anhydrase 1, chloroplastic [Ipomoea batatas]
MAIKKIMAMVFVVAALCMLNTRAAYVEDAYPAYFSYSGSTGPQFWGSLSPSYAKCSNGSAQSPINIVNRDTVLNRSLNALNIQFRDSVNATLINYGFKVEILFLGDAGTLVFRGKTYALSEIHWHTPSDHRIDGIQFTAELHMVHSAADSSRAVVSVLLQSGQSDPIVTKIQQQLSQLPMRPQNQTPPEIPLVNLNIQELRNLTTTKRYYTYPGSLTNPPCTEGITWIIIGKIGTISRAQVAALKRPLDNGSKNNARPVQPLNGRKVEVYQAMFP